MIYYNYDLHFVATWCRYLPREVDPLVYNMSTEDPGDISYAQIGGLSDQIRELREVIKTSGNHNLGCNFWKSATKCPLNQSFNCSF